MEQKISPIKIESKPSSSKMELLDILKLLAPGTSLRNALNDIRMAKLGALIVVDKKGLSEICYGGFNVDCKFTPQRLIELSKMDSGIILSSNMKRILRVNTLLVPNISVKTNETGTRHQAAERTAKQMETLVIAISERRHKITIYYGNLNYELEHESSVRRKAMDTLQTLEKQREMFDDSIAHLNILEINNLVTISDVCGVLQRIEIIQRIYEQMKKYLIELGNEGVIVSMRLRELIKNLNWEKEMVLKDYFKDYVRINNLLKTMNFNFLIETSNLSRTLFGELHDKMVVSKGRRILSKANILEKDIIILMRRYKTLDNIFGADKESLVTIIKNQNVVDVLIPDLKNIEERIRAGKKV